MNLSDVRAVVTGGVSGLGFAVAQHIVRHGGKAALFDINDDKAASALAELGGDTAAYYKTDVSDEAQVASHMQKAKEFMGGLNVAINCAGILGAGRVLGREASMPLNQFATTVKVNLIGSFNVAKAAAELMQHNAPGEDGEREDDHRAGLTMRSLTCGGRRPAATRSHHSCAKWVGATWRIPPSGAPANAASSA